MMHRISVRDCEGGVVTSVVVDELPNAFDINLDEGQYMDICRVDISHDEIFEIQHFVEAEVA